MKNYLRILFFIFILINLLVFSAFGNNYTSAQSSNLLSLSDSTSSGEIQKIEEENSSSDTEDSNSPVDSENQDSSEDETIDENNPDIDTPSSDQPDSPVIIEEKKPQFIDTLVTGNKWSNKTVYLSFDDGPSLITEQILDILKDENIKATFFVSGIKSDYQKSLLKRIANEGHAIGNHTYSHNYDYIYSNATNFFKDLAINEGLIYEATGIRPKIVRFPGGSNNKVSQSKEGKEIMTQIIDKLNKMGYIYFDWNASSSDASTPPPTEDDIINNTLSWINKHNNAIVLFHDTNTKMSTVNSLLVIIKKLKFLGCNFDVLSKDSFRVSFYKKPSNTYSGKNVIPVKPQYIMDKLRRLDENLSRL